MEITFENKKLELIQWLSTFENADILEKLMDLRKSEKTDWWENISDTEKNSIEKGLEDAEKGNLKPHSEAKKLYGKWL